LHNGLVLEAEIVVSNADPKRTFLGLVGRECLDEDFVRQVEAIAMNGPCAKVNLVLAEDPRVNGMPPGATRWATAWSRSSAATRRTCRAPWSAGT
jgi:hypothetical protein